MPRGGARPGAGRKQSLAEEDEILIGAACQYVHNKNRERNARRVLARDRASLHHLFRQQNQLRRSCPEAARLAADYRNADEPPPEPALAKLGPQGRDVFHRMSDLFEEIRLVRDGLQGDELDGMTSDAGSPPPLGRQQHVPLKRPKGRAGESERDRVKKIVRRWWRRKRGADLSMPRIDKCWKQYRDFLKRTDDLPEDPDVEVPTDLNNRRASSPFDGEAQ